MNAHISASSGPRIGSRIGWLFAAPALILLAVFFLLPVLGALVLSFTDFDIYALGDLSLLRWVGVENYRRLLADPQFWIAFRNTLYFVAVGGSLTVLASLGLALLLNQSFVRAKGLLRTLLFLPTVTTIVAVAVVWRYLYHPRIGLLNQVLAQIGVAPQDWLGDPDLAMPALILMAIWKNAGVGMIILTAGLQAIPERLYEAARLDGAGAWQRFRFITLPSLRPSLLFVGLMTVIGYFQFFAEPYVMTAGGPSNSTLSLSLLMFQEGFRWWNIGYASAMAFVLFGIVLAVGSVHQRLRSWQR